MALQEVYDFEKFYACMAEQYAREIRECRAKLSNVIQAEIERRNEAHESVDLDQLLLFLADSMKPTHEEAGTALDQSNFLLLAKCARRLTGLAERGMSDAGSLPSWLTACTKLKQLEDLNESHNRGQKVAFMRGKLGAILQSYIAAPTHKMVDPGWFGLGCVMSNLVEELSGHEIVLRMMRQALTPKQQPPSVTKRKSVPGMRPILAPIDRIALAIVATGVPFGYLAEGTTPELVKEVLHGKFLLAHKAPTTEASKSIIVSPSFAPNEPSSNKLS